MHNTIQLSPAIQLQLENGLHPQQLIAFRRALAEQIVISGPSGSGKTFLLLRLGLAFESLDMPVVYWSGPATHNTRSLLNELYPDLSTTILFTDDPKATEGAVVLIDQAHFVKPQLQQWLTGATHVVLANDPYFETFDYPTVDLGLRVDYLSQPVLIHELEPEDQLSIIQEELNKHKSVFVISQKLEIPCGSVEQFDNNRADCVIVCLDIQDYERAIARSKSKTIIFLRPSQQHSFKNYQVISHPKRSSKRMDVGMLSASLLQQQPTIKITLGNLWQVTITREAKQQLEKVSPSVIQQFVHFLRDMTCGKQTQTLVDLMQFRIQSYSVVISVELEPYDGQYRQMIKIWNVCDASLTPKIFNRVKEIRSKRSKAYLEQTRQLNITVMDNQRVIVPRLVPRDFEIRYREPVVDQSLIKEHVLDQMFVDALDRLSIQDMELPYKLGEEEQSLVDHIDPLLILGRSGTGKTTVLMAKMMRNEFNGIRSQLYVTLNKRLAETVKGLYMRTRSMYPLEQNPPLFLCLKEFLDMKSKTDRKVIGFFEFQRMYTRFPEKAKKFSVGQLWTEFQTVIKASIPHLTKSEYQRLEDSRRSILSAEERALIYQQFQFYEANKTDWDMSDYCQHIIENNDFEQKWYMLVDEVQDLTTLELQILIRSAREDGFVFCGDTAQSIAHGQGFRFQDLKSVIYDQLTTKVPRLHSLRINYRSHDGIVQLANQLLKLLVRFFPDEIDRIEQEQSLCAGETPVFLTNQSVLETEFGPQQAVLVRNHSRINELFNGLVLTVHESKGMEFDDVVLYNFIKDAPFDRWHALHIDGYHGFDPKRDHLLLQELKILYVAITRARSRVVIVDDDCFIYTLLKPYMRSQESVDLHTQGTAEEWKVRGLEFFDRLNFEKAIQCFERAQEPDLTKKSQAMLLYQRGSYTEAGDLFQDIRDLEMALQVYSEAKMDQRTIEILVCLSRLDEAIALCASNDMTEAFIKMLKKEDKEKYCFLLANRLSFNTLVQYVKTDLLRYCFELSHAPKFAELAFDEHLENMWLEHVSLPLLLDQMRVFKCHPSLYNLKKRRVNSKLYKLIHSTRDIPHKWPDYKQLAQTWYECYHESKRLQLMHKEITEWVIREFESVKLETCLVCPQLIKNYQPVTCKCDHLHDFETAQKWQPALLRFVALGVQLTPKFRGIYDQLLSIHALVQFNSEEFFQERLLYSNRPQDPFGFQDLLSQCNPTPLMPLSLRRWRAVGQPQCFLTSMDTRDLLFPIVDRMQEFLEWHDAQPFQHPARTGIRMLYGYLIAFGYPLDKCILPEQASLERSSLQAWYQIRKDPLSPQMYWKRELSDKIKQKTLDWIWRSKNNRLHLKTMDRLSIYTCLRQSK
ncbi:hypothetical protein EDD86DRAFT_199714 [Gorgonomyces haynaldii]|nr:hypothetical protein EDD86DRAFT_199714 [Gorgonomyces haynaldii]